MLKRSFQPRRVVLATPPVYQAPLPLEVHLPMIPQGPAMLAAILQCCGHHVSCFDAYERSCRIGYFDASEFAAFLLAERPDWLGLSVYSDGYPSSLAMIEIAKAVLPECRVIVGGPHFTLFPDVASSQVDYVVAGEGEFAIVASIEGRLPEVDQENRDFLFRIEASDSGLLFDGKLNAKFNIVEEVSTIAEIGVLQDLRASIRLSSNGSSRIITMHERLSNSVLGRLPHPAFNLFLGPHVTYQFDEPALGLDGPMLNLNTSRGCSYGCSFCSVEGVWGKPYSWFPSEWVLGLVKKLKQEYGLRSIFFREDEFIMRPRARTAWDPADRFGDDVMQLAEGLSALGIRWAVENRADGFGRSDLAESYFKKLASLGLSGVFVGVESGSDKVRNRILNKHLSEEALRAFFDWAHETRVRTVANVMYGVRRRIQGEVLSDDRDDWIVTDQLLEELKPTRVDRYVFVGVPMSPLYRDYLGRGDYDLIDVNGYLYPKGFKSLAEEVYGHNIDMFIIQGHPNLRVGPGLLPGIPVAAKTPQITFEMIVSAIERLEKLPGVLNLSLTQLHSHKHCLPESYGNESQLLISVGRSPLPDGIIVDVLKRYRPGERPRVERLKMGPTLALATLRSPSAETVLIALQVAHDTVDFEMILTPLEHTVAMASTYLRSRFVESYASAPTLVQLKLA